MSPKSATLEHGDLGDVVYYLYKAWYNGTKVKKVMKKVFKET